jgi:heptosyltransferase III
VASAGADGKRHVVCGGIFCVYPKGNNGSRTCAGQARSYVEPMRRLLIRPHAIGDCLVTFPAMEALALPGTDVWISTPVVPLVGFARARCSTAAGMELLSHPCMWSLAGFPEALSPYDEIISWFGEYSEIWVDMLAGNGRRVHLLPTLPEEPGELHAVDYHNRNVEQLGVEMAHLPSATPSLRTVSWNGSGSFAAIQPFASHHLKEWPFESYLGLEQILSKKLPVRWIVEPSRRFPSPPQGQVLHLSNLLEVANVISQAALFVGNDSGVSHLAAAVGAPAVVIFMRGNPAIWRARGKAPVLTPEPKLNDVADACFSLLPAVR